MKNQYQLPCNIAQTLNLIGDRWTLLILHRILNGIDTFKELQERLEGIPSNLLSDRLKCLEAEDLITSSLYQQHPPRYHYELTESGKDLSDLFNSIVIWGEKHLKKCYKQLSHLECGHRLELQYFCPHCGRSVPKDQICVTEYTMNEGMALE